MRWSAFWVGIGWLVWAGAATAQGPGGAIAPTGPTGALEGRVLDELTGEPVAGISVAALRRFDIFFLQQGADVTDDEGFFRIENLEPLGYVVATFDPGEFYLYEIYPDIECRPAFDCDYLDGEPIAVEAEETSTVELRIRKGGQVEGEAHDRLTGMPLFGATLELYEPSGEPAARGYVSHGEVHARSVAPGTYYGLLTGTGLAPQVLGGPECDPDACDPLSGTPIEIRPGEITAGLDFEPRVVGCTGSPREGCMQDGRFRVVGRWEDAAGKLDYGHFMPLSDDSAAFWFFSSGNYEGIVKVLDACASPSPRHWVFVAGLTDVQVTLWVTDLLTGKTRTYENPQGRPLPPIQDTQAFADCEAPLTDLEGAGRPPAIPGSSVSAMPSKSCPQASGVLCLADGRFQVEAFYRGPGDGEERSAAASPLPFSEDSGYFWFFEPANVELLVKVLDGCAFNERFWVFGAGLTDVQVRLRVTDTETGQVREYENDAGNAFLPVQDTVAFNTCF